MDKIEDILYKIEGIYKKYHQKKSIYTDPVKFIHRYSNSKDQEVVGFIAATFAHGRAEQIFTTVEKILSFLGKNPYTTLLNLKKPSNFPPIQHRFNDSEDVKSFLFGLGKAIRTFGSLKRLFLIYYKDKESIKESLDCFINTLYIMLPRRSKTLRFLLSTPFEGSACRRLNLFLKWMVRKDQIDLGLWGEVSPSKLIIPLDTHIWKISKEFGLTSCTTPSWRAAEEITEKLRILDSNDPVKYDFALKKLHLTFEE